MDFFFVSTYSVNSFWQINKAPLLSINTTIFRGYLYLSIPTTQVVGSCYFFIFYCTSYKEVLRSCNYNIWIFICVNVYELKHSIMFHIYYFFYKRKHKYFFRIFYKFLYNLLITLNLHTYRGVYKKDWKVFIN